MHGPVWAGTCCKGLGTARHQDVCTSSTLKRICLKIRADLSLSTDCSLALVASQCVHPAIRQHLQMCKIPLFSYISDVSPGCVFWILLLVIIREFLQTSYVMFLAALVAQRGLSPDVNTQESPSRAFVFECKDTPERNISNLGLRHVSCQKCIWVQRNTYTMFSFSFM